MSGDDRGAALPQVTGLILQKARADLATLQQKAGGLRRNLADLGAQRADWAQVARPADDPALIAGADLRWQQWADQRRAAINNELAQVMAQIALAQQRLQRAFGRDQAAQALARQAVKNRAVQKSRRAGYES